MTQQAHSRVSGLILVNGLNFELEVLHADRPVLLDVSTAWCGPCRVAAPLVREIAETEGERVKVVLVDGEESPELVQSLRVRAFPTFIVFSQGQELRRASGFSSKRVLLELAGIGGAHAMR